MRQIGVTFTEKRNVTPIEISTLENLSCFLKLPENFPITKLKMSYKELPKAQPAFKINDEMLRIEKDLVKEVQETSIHVSCETESSFVVEERPKFQASA